ncbi:MAG: tetratricopeptide repeat protein [Phycisphaerales bacterium]|nr:MAG: tetratricopeptide repeat protein [Phycisphaerales bacterium]
MSIAISLCVASSAESQSTVHLANTAFEEGRYADAVTYYREALSEEPTFAVNVNLGHAYTRLERWTDAIASYQAAIELDPSSASADVWFFLGQAHYQIRQYDEALDVLLEVASSGTNGQVSLWIARCLTELEQWLRAKTVLLTHLGTYPKDLEALELLAHVLGQTNDWPGVIDVYRGLLAADGDRTRYRIALANALVIAEQNQEAIDTLELAWRIDRSVTVQANHLLADLYLAERMPYEASQCYARAIRQMDQPRADDYFRLATAYFQAREFVSATDALNKMHEDDPMDSRVDLYLGHIAVETDRLQEAEEHFGAALAKAPASTETLLALARLEMQQQRCNEAATHFARALQAGDKRLQVHYDHVLALLHLPDRARETKTALRNALALYPSEPRLQALLDRYVRQRSSAREGMRQ